MIFINHTDNLDGKVIVVEIKGILNSETSTDFEDYINQLLIKRKVFIILNMENLDHISSAGIGVILYIQKKIIASKGYFIICNVSEEISALYEILGFDKLIRITQSKDEALNIMKNQLTLIESESSEKTASTETHMGSVISPDLEKKQFTVESVNAQSVPDEGKTFEHPIILECAECKSMIRVKKSGNYICPDCKKEFLVEPDQTVVF
jgi:anti-anti-sigma factor